MLPILRYHLFFRKEIYFFECLYLNEYNIQMSLYDLYDFEPSIKYVCNWWEDERGRGEVHQKCVQLRTEGGGVTTLLYVRTYTSTLT